MRIAAVIQRIFNEMLRDKRTLAMLFVAPLLILSLMYLLFNPEPIKLKIGTVGVDESVISLLEETDMQVIEYDERTNLTGIIVEDELDAILSLENNNWFLTLENGEPSTGKTIYMKMNQIISSRIQMNFLDIEAKEKLANDNIEVEYIYGNSETEFFDVLSPILVGFFVFFFVFLISGIGLLKERTTGTLERLLSTPIKRWEIVTAYLVGFGTFAIIQTVIVVFFSIHVLDMVLVGSIWSVIIINLLLALVALSLGTLLSTFATSEFQMVQFIPVVVIPQIFFSGILPFEGMANWLQSLAKIMPLYYAATSLKDIMYKGYSLSDVSSNIYVLTGFAFVFILLNILALKKYRKL